MIWTKLSIVDERIESVGYAFISYVRENSDEVDRLQQILQSAGIQVWRDTDSLWPGEDWRQKIRRAITADALVFIACFSTKSLARGKTYQNEELTLAIEQLRLRPPDTPWLIPVRLDECDIPDDDIGRGRTLRSTQCVDLFGDRHNESAKRLVAAVERILSQRSSPLSATKQEAQDTDQGQRQGSPETPVMISSLPGNPHATERNTKPSIADRAVTKKPARHGAKQPSRKARRRRLILAIAILSIMATAISFVSVVLFSDNQPLGAQPTPVRTIGFADWVAAVTFSRNGSMMATATGDGDHEVTLWNVKDPARPTQIATFQPRHRYRAHSGLLSERVDPCHSKLGRYRDLVEYSSIYAPATPAIRHERKPLLLRPRLPRAPDRPVRCSYVDEC